MAKAREAKDPCNVIIAWARGIPAFSATLPKAPARKALGPCAGIAAGKAMMPSIAPVKEAANMSRRAKAKAKETEASLTFLEAKDGARVRAKAMAARAKAMAAKAKAR